MVFSNKNNISYYIKISIFIKYIVGIGFGFGCPSGTDPTQSNEMRDRRSVFDNWT